MVRTATPRLEVWFSQPLWPDPIERGAASSQHAGREQDCANQDCDQHGAHDTEPFLVGRRVGDFAFKNFAHRTTPSINRYAVSRARGFLCGTSWRQLWRVGRNVEKAGWCSCWVTKRSGSPRSIARGPRG